LRSAWFSIQALGRDLSLSWWVSRLMIEGVQKVEPINPVQDVVANPQEAIAIGEIKRAKHITRPADFLPFLVDEYGLGELTPYVPNVYDLLDEGIKWQRIRGSLASIDMGLAWLGYSASFKAAWPGRRWWNSFQLYFDQLPENDFPDLERIEGITNLSKNTRSDLRRAVFQYDAGPVVQDGCRLDMAMIERESG